MKTLIAYFSAEGRTEGFAKALAEAVDAEMFAIIPEQPYSAADLKWTNPLARCNREKMGKKDVPVAGIVDAWDEYDTVCLGFPIWYYAAPNVVNTFCKAYDWTGKKLILFATSGGSDIGKTAEKLKPYLKGDPQILSAGVYRDPKDLVSAAAKLL
jgi:flavodoxin